MFAPPQIPPPSFNEASDNPFDSESDPFATPSFSAPLPAPRPVSDIDAAMGELFGGPSAPVSAEKKSEPSKSTADDDFDLFMSQNK
jgi:hypothetical protein